MNRIAAIILALGIFLSGCGKQVINPTPTVIAVPPTASSTIIPSPSPTPAPTFTATATLLPKPVFYTNPQAYQVEYSVRVVNGSFTLTDLRLYQPRLVEWDSQKNVQEVSVSPAVSQASTDPVYGNGIYYWHLAGQPKPGGFVDFVFQAKVTVYEILTQINPDALMPYKVDDPAYALYTRPEKYIESDDAQIVDLANKIAGDEKNPYRLARKFYDTILQTVHLNITGQGLNGALSTLQKGNGEAGDYAALFVALCRARGIPARPVVGYLALAGLDQTTVWAEFFVEPFGWIPVDPVSGQQNLPLRDYYFGNLDNGRIITNKGYNVPLVPASPDKVPVAYLQVPFYWFWGSAGQSDTVSMFRNTWMVQKIP